MICSGLWLDELFIDNQLMEVTSDYIYNLRALYCALSVWRQVVKLCVKHSIKAADHRRRKRGGQGGHVPPNNMIGGDNIAIVPPPSIFRSRSDVSVRLNGSNACLVKDE